MIAGTKQERAVYCAVLGGIGVLFSGVVALREPHILPDPSQRQHQGLVCSLAAAGGCLGAAIALAVRLTGTDRPLAQLFMVVVAAATLLVAIAAILTIASSPELFPFLALFGTATVASYGATSIWLDRLQALRTGEAEDCSADS